MATSTGIQLAQGITRKIEELKKVCEWLDESMASRAPAGRWSPKEILSHLWGPEGSGRLPILQAFLDEETPTIDMEPGNPYFSEKRARMTFSQSSQRSKGSMRVSPSLRRAYPGSSSTGRHISLCSKTHRWENTRHWKASSGDWGSFMFNFTLTICVRFCRV